MARLSVPSTASRNVGQRRFEDGWIKIFGQVARIIVAEETINRAGQSRKPLTYFTFFGHTARVTLCISATPSGQGPPRTHEGRDGA
jgi:hypothetical protein